MDDHNFKSHHGVICTRCGPQGLNDEQYTAQMMKPDSLWVCPVCGDESWWDDDRYEVGCDIDYDNLSDDSKEQLGLLPPLDETQASVDQ